MKQNKISILGSGWLGLPLAKHLVELGYPVNLSTRQTNKFTALAQTGAAPYIVDIDQDNCDLDAFLADVDVLICNITSKNHAGFDHLIQQISRAKVKHVLFISSTSVYRNVNASVAENADDEDQASALYQIEQAFQGCPTFNTSILRLSGLVGYKRHPGRFFAQGKVVQQPNAPVNLIHRDDCLAMIRHIIQQGAWGEVFNGCSDTHPTKRAFYSYARTLLSAPPPTFADSSPSHLKIVSNAKIKHTLGLDLIHPDLMQCQFNETG